MCLFDFSKTAVYVDSFPELVDNPDAYVKPREVEVFVGSVYVSRTLTRRPAPPCFRPFHDLITSSFWGSLGPSAPFLAVFSSI